MNYIDLKTQYKLLLEHDSDDLDKNRSSLLRIIQITTDLAQVIHDANIKVEHWECYFETLIEKIIHSSLSVVKLSEGYYLNTYKDKCQILTIDTSSIFALTRTIIESYLTLYHIYLDKISIPERIFKFKLWQVSGILTRQNINYYSSPSLEKRKQDERRIIEILIKELEADKEFVKLDKTRIKKLKTFGLPRLDSWSELIRKSNLKDSMVDIYSLLSSYSHSEFLSIVQMRQSSFTISDNENINRLRISFSIIRIINALIAEWLINKYKSIEIVYNTMPEDYKKFIQIWSKVGRKTCP
jgi:hypothetical protein